MNKLIYNGTFLIGAPNDLGCGPQVIRAPFIQPTNGIPFDYATGAKLPLDGNGGKQLYDPPDINLDLLNQTLGQIPRGGVYLLDFEGLSPADGMPFAFKSPYDTPAKWAQWLGQVLRTIRKFRPDLTRCVLLNAIDPLDASFRTHILPNCEALADGFYLRPPDMPDREQVDEQESFMRAMYGMGHDCEYITSFLTCYQSVCSRWGWFARSHGKIPVVYSQLCWGYGSPSALEFKPLRADHIETMIRQAWDLGCIPYLWGDPESPLLEKIMPDTHGQNFSRYKAEYPWLVALREIVERWGK